MSDHHRPWRQRKPKHRKPYRRESHIYHRLKHGVLTHLDAVGIMDGGPGKTAAQFIEFDPIAP